MADNSMTVRTPWHLWLVGVVSLAWNAYGGYDYVMSTTRGETYWRASGRSQAMIDYFHAMPVWMYLPWSLGVWGAVIGSLFLLLRNRLAVPAFGLSLLGAIGNVVYGWMHPMPELPPQMALMKYMPYGIVAIAAFLAWYAWTMRKQGVLR